MAAEQLLARGLGSTNPHGQDWHPPEPSELDDSIGDRYHVTEIIGHGGMGAVYKATDTRLERIVAIKILPEEFAENPAILSRFEREAKSLAALDHPNIVKIHDYGFSASGSPFFVMEFVRGHDIQSLRSQGKLDLLTALTMISQVCDAIDYAHRRKIIHRDIKPANIIVDEHGRTKVADFGLAKLLETDTRPHHQPDLTMTGQVMGTPAYMAPEQESGEPVDHRTDIYALGVMLYNLLTGVPPRGAWSLPSEVASVDSRLDQIVLRALQEKPAARYQSASEFREDIESVIGDTGGEALPPGTEPMPLPSSAGAAPITTGRFVNRKKTTISLELPGSESIDAEFLSTARSMNNTVLVLGLLAMLVIGGLALYLANRKTGDVSTLTQTIVTSETHNTFFNQLIAMGVTTDSAMAEIGAIRPYPGGYIGLSKHPLSQIRASGLAEKTGAKMLEIPAPSDAETPALVTWIRQNLANGVTAWITRDTKPHLLVGDLVVPEVDPASIHQVLLFWSHDQPAVAENGQENRATLPPTPSIPEPDIFTPAPTPGEPPAMPEPHSVDIPEESEASSQPEPEPAIDVWIDTQGRRIEARFLRLEDQILIIDFNDHEARVPLERLSTESRALALKRQSESKP